MTTTAFVCLALLSVITLAAAVRNDIRTTRLTRATLVAFKEVDQNTEKFRNCINKTHATVVDHRKDVLLMDVDLHRAMDRITTLEGKKLYRIYAKRLADGTFKRVKPRQVSGRRRK